MSLKESKQKRIESITYSFDSYFDNTVVDTYAFEKALHSATLVALIQTGIASDKKETSCDLMSLKSQATSLLIHEVEALYAVTGHRVCRPNVYRDYVDRLFTRIYEPEASNLKGPSL